MVQEKKGGYALATQGVTTIRKDAIPATIKTFARLSGIPLSDIHTIGSAGKVEVSGDIDIAVNAWLYNHEEVNRNLSLLFPDVSNTFNVGTKVGSYVFPTTLNLDGPLVQIDVMYVDNPELAEFTYFSPGDASQYKGAIRTILLQAVASAMYVEGTDYFEYDSDGALLLRAARTLDLSVGLRRIFQHRPMRKDGNGRVKTLKTIDRAEFLKLYPHIYVVDTGPTTQRPNEIVRILFGPGVTPQDVETAEQVFELLHDSGHFTFVQRKRILSIARARYRGLESKMAIPPELYDRY